jgi:beta-glucosidase
MRYSFLRVLLGLSGLLATAFVYLPKQGAAQKSALSQLERPWLDRNISPDQRAEFVLKVMTLDEKIALLHGVGIPTEEPLTSENALSNRGVGYVAGIPRLAIPGIDMSDAAYGVRSSGENGRYSTALPANIAAAASWDSELAFEYGALIGRELRAQGFNMSLGGGVNLAREARNGRTFEYLGEDPVLSGTLVGNYIAGTQSAHVMGSIKHFAMNDQESGRDSINVVMGKKEMRESDLLAFEIGIAIGQPAAVMCSYNRVNGDYACENDYLLHDLLRKSWHFPGFVLSDWGGTHSTEKASAAGLDNEEPGSSFYGNRFKLAVLAGQIPTAELDGHVRRILRSEFAAGIVDYPRQRSVVDPFAGLEVARKVEEASIVLLKNSNGVLPLDSAKIRTIAVIGAHADVGMVSGGGSAQVDPPVGNALPAAGHGGTQWQDEVWFPTAPLKAIRARAPKATVTFDSGSDPKSASAAARNAEVAIVFAYQWECEDRDLPNLSLPHGQDELIAEVVAANPRTLVVLETGGPVKMPWSHEAAAILEAWYAGSDGANAVANVLFGSVNPSGKLPLTFPLSERDLPHPVIAMAPREPRELTPFSVSDAGGHDPDNRLAYDEGVKVGYKWFDSANKAVLFPFGFGLSYTSYEYGGLQVSSGDIVKVVFTVVNTGRRPGTEIAEVYASLPYSAKEPPKRLVGWSKVTLDAGEKKTVTVEIDRKYLSVFDEARDGWILIPGEYLIAVGGSSQDLPLKAVVNLQ